MMMKRNKEKKRGTKEEKQALGALRKIAKSHPHFLMLCGRLADLLRLERLEQEHDETTATILARLSYLLSSLEEHLKGHSEATGTAPAPSSAYVLKTDLKTLEMFIQRVANTAAWFPALDDSPAGNVTWTDQDASNWSTHRSSVLIIHFLSKEVLPKARGVLSELPNPDDDNE